MNISELQKYLQEITQKEITQSEIAKALKKDRSNICNKAKRGTELKVSELKEIEEYFKVNLFTNSQQFVVNKKTETLEYIHINPSCGSGTICIDEPEITPITLGTELIKNVLKVANPKNLKIFKASGDSMEPTIYNDDILIVDIGNSDYINGGVFIINKDNDFFCKRLQLKFNGDLDIISDNNKYKTETITKNNEYINLNIVGKVLKNLSHGL